MHREFADSAGDESIGRRFADAMSQLSRLDQRHHHRLDVPVAAAGFGSGSQCFSQRRKQRTNDERTFKHKVRDPFLSESDCATGIQGSDRESHRVRTYIRVAIYSGLRDEVETTKLCHAEAFPGLYQHLFETVGREEELYKFALCTSFRRWLNFFTNYLIFYISSISNVTIF